MLAVNLLPWRAQQLLLRRQHSVALLVVVLLVTLLLTLLLWWRAEQRLQHAVRQHTDMTIQLQQIQQRLAQQQTLMAQRDDLLRRQQAQQQRLQQHQRWQQFWQQLPALMPETLWLSRVERRQGQLVLDGLAQSLADVSAFRHQLQTQPLFAAVKQGSVQRQAQGDYRFALRARLQETTDE